LRAAESKRHKQQQQRAATAAAGSGDGSTPSPRHRTSSGTSRPIPDGAKAGSVTGSGSIAQGPPYTSHTRSGGRILRQNDRVHPNPAVATADSSKRSTATRKGLSHRLGPEGHHASHARSHTVDTEKGVVVEATNNTMGPSANKSNSNGSSTTAASAKGVSFRRLRRSGNNNGATAPPTVDANAANAEYDKRRSSKKGSSTPTTDASTPASSSPQYNPKTPAGVRGRGDLRSPGARKTPVAANIQNQAAIAAAAAAAQQQDDVPIPDFITQTDKYGNATTPRSADAIAGARRQHPSGPEPHIHVTSDGKAIDDEGHVLKAHEIDRHDNEEDIDPCDALLESLRNMCCCLVPEDSSGAATKTVRGATASCSTAPPAGGASKGRSQYATRESTQQIMYEDAAAENQVKLLPAHHPDDRGKKCLVLDLDETLVHSSFRAVPGADFVIPVQIEDVVHFVYVMKRPGVDEFLIEMAKHYEIVIYTASLNKYADPLLDLLDPHKTIRTRLFRESCVYYEGNYVKDLSLLDRDLRQSIIIDNSPNSYIFHPENAIDCSSFIDDPNDRELDQIGAFLKGIRNVDDVRGTSNMWRDWPHLPNVEGLVYDSEEDDR